MAWDTQSSDLLLTDHGYDRVLRVAVDHGLMTSWCGTGTAGFAPGDCTAAAQFNAPFSVAVDAVGDVYVADKQRFIRHITAAATVVTDIGSTAV